MAFGFTTFTILWAVSCIIVYFRMVHMLDEATRLYDDAKEKYAQAVEDSEAASLRLKQIEASMKSLN